MVGLAVYVGCYNPSSVGVLYMGNMADRYRDIRLNIDNMSNEELVALGERIGRVSTGLSNKTITNRLKKRKYKCIKADKDKKGEEECKCCICQEEYKKGEDIGTLECGHYHHLRCIKKWLRCKNLCPICKTTGLNE